MKALIVLFTLFNMATLSASPLKKACENYEKAMEQVREHASEVYEVIDQTMINPLLELGLESYATRLAVSTQEIGNVISEKHCESLAILHNCLEAVKLSEDAEFINGKDYFTMLSGFVIDPLNEAGYEDMYNVYKEQLDPTSDFYQDFSLETCQEIGAELKV